ncbi:hypothetical protein Msil_3090 [Methylocella silvestris BL2]|uniref:Uncharacterized protein n=1 Tax=Methylocella silvestris (strain DSM 15510 / CIP 108128 / LMG 27833 / NCIMB 13906 / BL2) TaxID=395965 RepID=B8EKX1_METSB|nr:hypothetical protein [Methylocella silvestris]ACK51999.1 hypothetical protein Msil_3090 [Methylocella silvestris BL2]
MTRTPMPSPRGTNHAGLYLRSGSGLAQDASAELPDASSVCDWIQENLSVEDIAQLLESLKAHVDGAAGATVEDDDPENDDPEAVAAAKEKRNLAGDAANDKDLAEAVRRHYATDASVRARLREREMGRDPHARPQTAKERAAYEKQFPNANRLNR